MERVGILIIGGGQAGLAMSEHLSRNNLPHLVVERGQIAQRWRSERWDSLVSNGPAWHDRFPTKEIAGVEPDAFASRNAIVSYFEEYAAMISAPVRCGVEVTELSRHSDKGGFLALTREGTIHADKVVIATGPFQRPVIPTIVGSDSGILQLHSAHYRNPGQLPDGSVLVVGAGSSGAQIADELNRAGRKVYLSVGPHNRPPRRYRGRDFAWWLDELDMWSAPKPVAGKEHIAIAVSGAHGGYTVDFRELAARGVILVGRTEGFDGASITFASDLADNIAIGDADYIALLDAVDAHIAELGLDFPEEPEARRFAADPECLTVPVSKLNVSDANLSAMVWATGYALDFGWINADIFDNRGFPRHVGGVTEIPGLFFLGLPWLSNRASAFIWGVWRDAQRLAGVIANADSGIAGNLPSA